MGGFLNRRFQRQDHVLAFGQSRQVGKVLGNGLAGHGQAVTIEQTLFKQVLHNGRNATDVVQVFHHVFAGRL